MSNASIKLVLDQDELLEYFTYQSTFLGIIANVPASYICCGLNERFGLNITTSLELKLVSKSKDRIQEFPVDSFDLPKTESRYVLYKLKMDGQDLLTELKQFDYLLYIQSEQYYEKRLVIHAYLNTIPEIQIVKSFECSDIKQLAYLIV